MRYPWMIVPLAMTALGCGPSDDDVRALVRSELERSSAVEHITDASVIGPYSPAIKAGNFLFVSGQIGLDPGTMQLAGADIETQTRRSLDNMMTILAKAGYDSSHVIQCTVFLKDINDYQRMNLVYGGYFEDNRYPARMAVEVSDLPRNALVEVSAVAYKRSGP